MATVINGNTGIDKVQDGSITPEDLVQKMTLMTAQTASGTSIDFTGIPSWAKRITVMLNEVSTNGASPVIIRLGSGSIDTTGYVSTGLLYGTSTVGQQETSGLSIIGTTANDSRVGNMSLNLISNNSWVFSGCGKINTSGGIWMMTCAGNKSLSGTLDRIRITTVNGTDTFDAGTINIMYEG